MNNDIKSEIQNAIDKRIEQERQIVDFLDRKKRKGAFQDNLKKTKYAKQKLQNKG